MEHNVDFKERLDDFWVYPKLSKKQNRRNYTDNYFTFLNNENLSCAKNNLYIHIPFCKTRCIYCDFYSTTRSELKSRYIHALCKELQMRKEYLRGEPVETVYFGGGTPSQLAEEDFR